VSVYTEGTDVKPSEIARKGLAEAKKKNIDVVIVDTAGRLQVNTLFVSGHLDSYKICPVTLFGQHLSVYDFTGIHSIFKMFNR
jgi:hypothetical protein